MTWWVFFFAVQLLLMSRSSSPTSCSERVSMEPGGYMSWDDFKEGKLELGPVSGPVQRRDSVRALRFGSRKFNFIIQRDEASTVAPKLQISNVQPPLLPAEKKPVGCLLKQQVDHKSSPDSVWVYLQPGGCVSLWQSSQERTNLQVPRIVQSFLKDRLRRLSPPPPVLYSLQPQLQILKI